MNYNEQHFHLGVRLILNVICQDTAVMLFICRLSEIKLKAALGWNHLV